MSGKTCKNEFSLHLWLHRTNVRLALCVFHSPISLISLSFEDFFSFKFQRSVLTNGCECDDEEHESAAFRRQKLRKNQFKGCTKGLDRFSLSKMGL